MMISSIKHIRRTESSHLGPSCPFNIVAGDLNNSNTNLLDKYSPPTNSRYCIEYVNYNEDLECPELSPWLQKATKKSKPKTFKHKLPTKDFNPNNYRFLRRSRYLEKYYQPLTVSYRYYDETECYIEEYRLFKSPTIIQTERESSSVSASSTKSSEHSCYKCRIKERSGLRKMKAIRRNDNYLCQEKLMLKDMRSRLQCRTYGSITDVAENYINNARPISAGKRMPIKIPKCETKTRQTIFPIILSRYNNYSSYAP